MAKRLDMMLCLRFSLEDHLGCELQDARRSGCGGCYGTVGGLANGARRIYVVGLIQNVEGFRAEVKGSSFEVERKDLVETDIQVVIGVKADRVAAGVSIGMVHVRHADCRSIESEERSVRGVFDAFGSGQHDRRADDIRPVSKDVADVLKRVFAVNEVGRNSAAGGVDCGDLPAAKYLLHQERSVASERAAFAIGKIVDDGKNIVQRLIVRGGAAVAERVSQIDARIVAGRGVEMP
jgi:hypothetical protein